MAPDTPTLTQLLRRGRQGDGAAVDEAMPFAVMWQILVDHARAKVAAKRGGRQVRVAFSETLNYSDEKAADLVALDDALKELAASDERKARTIELRYFGGLSVDESAETLGVSAVTLGRETRYAEAWLRRKLSRG